MAKILVVGAQGQVGRSLVQQLQGKSDFLALGKQELDITDQKSVSVVVQSFRPEVIINTAAYTAVDKAESDVATARAVNVDGARNLALAAKLIDAAILHVSTDYVFSGECEVGYCYKETDRVNPQSVYGQTKLAGEGAVISEINKAVILRTAWVFGEYGSNFVKTMLRLAKQRDSLGIVSDQVGGPTYSGDIASVLISIANKILRKEDIDYGIYHFTGFPYVSWYDFAKTIFQEAVEQKVLEMAPQINAITTAGYPTPAKRPANSCLDLNKIQQSFGVRPSDWRRALKSLSAYNE